MLIVIIMNIVMIIANFVFFFILSANEKLNNDLLIQGWESCIDSYNRTLNDYYISQIKLMDVTDDYYDCEVDLVNARMELLGIQHPELNMTIKSK